MSFGISPWSHLEMDQSSCFFLLWNYKTKFMKSDTLYWMNWSNYWDIKQSCHCMYCNWVEPMKKKKNILLLWRTTMLGHKFKILTQGSLFCLKIDHGMTITNFDEIWRTLHILQATYKTKKFFYNKEYNAMLIMY